jgi:carbonic anhydrase/acetyltransferase-like protein (isoleucine patch superfamily)
VIPDNSVVMGSPGKVVKTLDEQGAARLRLSALHYAEHYKNFLNLEEFHF